MKQKQFNESPMGATTEEPMDAREFIKTLIEGNQETFIERINKLNDKGLMALFA